LACVIRQDQHPNFYKRKFGDFRESWIPQRLKCPTGGKVQIPSLPLPIVSLVIIVEQITLIITALILAVIVTVEETLMGGFAEMDLRMSSVSALPMGLAPHHLEAICLETLPINL
jgi:hypothetical protein